MWETPFDTSMLDGRVIIFCPSEENAVELMDILGKCGVKWDGKTMSGKGDSATTSNVRFTALTHRTSRPQATMS